MMKFHTQTQLHSSVCKQKDSVSCLIPTGPIRLRADGLLTTSRESCWLKITVITFTKYIYIYSFVVFKVLLILPLSSPFSASIFKEANRCAQDVCDQQFRWALLIWRKAIKTEKPRGSSFTSSLLFHFFLVMSLFYEDWMSASLIVTFINPSSPFSFSYSISLCVFSLR